MKTLLWVVGVLALQGLLVGVYLLINDQDPIILNPDRGGLVENGVTMVMFCGEDSGSGVLQEIPTGGRFDSWTWGRADVRGDCKIFYHHHRGYHPCHHNHRALTPCGRAARSWD